jgi:hypothetical protein
MSRPSPLRIVRVSTSDVQQINLHAMTMEARHVFSSTEIPGAVEHLQGECKNVRQILTDYPDGFTEFTVHYPQ